MGHRKTKRYHMSSSSSSDSSDSSSFSESSGNYPTVKSPRLTKKQMLQLIKLERKIQREESLLKKIQVLPRNKLSTKKKEVERSLSVSPTAKLARIAQSIPPPRPALKKKLYLTGFSMHIGREVLQKEIGCLVKSLRGADEYKVKVREGEKSYAIIMFRQEECAESALKMIRESEVLGEGINAVVSNDFIDSEDHKAMKCYECGENGHFARQCPVRFQKQASEKHEQDEAETASPIAKLQQSAPDLRIEKDEEERMKQAQKLIHDKNPNKRVIRDKTKFGRLQKI